MNWFSDFLDLLFPRSCEACNDTLLANEKLVCTSCTLSLPVIDYEKEKLQLYRKFMGKIEVKEVISYLKFSKKSKVQTLMHKLKYRGKKEIGIYLGELFGNDLKKRDFQEKIDLIVSLPLHQEKERQRGYNQADLIAEGISKSLKIRFDKDILKRVKFTESQTKKSRIERFMNVMNTFEVVDVEQVRGKRIALVDDILTTGSTLESCGEVLLENGCKELYIMTIASAV